MTPAPRHPGNPVDSGLRPSAVFRDSEAHRFGGTTMLLFVVALQLAAQAPRPIPADKAAQAAAIVEKSAASAYGRWGVSADGDTQVMKELATPRFARAVVDQRRRCGGKAGCVDRFTCLAERAVVERVTLLPSSTTAQLEARVELRGVTTSTRTAVEWVLQVAPTAPRLSDVRCPPTTPPPSSTTTTKPTTTPTTTSPPKTQTFQSEVKPKSTLEARIIDHLSETTEIGEDNARIAAVLKKWFTAEAVQQYIENARGCLEKEKEKTQGGDIDASCEGNLLMCTTDSVTLTSLEITEAGAVIALLRLAQGGQRRVTLFLDDEDKRRVRFTTHYCADPTGYIESPFTGLTSDPSAPLSNHTGHCNGFATCELSCTEPGCYRGITGRCMGSPTPCSSRGQGSCTGSCYWSQQ